MITQSQLAKELGVSQQAVSFALNGTGTLSETTRERILEGAERLGYRKNMASLTMQTGKTRSVGLLMRGNARSRMPPPFLMGVSTWLDDHDHMMSLVSVSEEQLSGKEASPLMFREHRVDGCLVLLRRDLSGNLPSMLKENRMPYIWINENFEHNAVYPDDVFLGQRGTELLLERGCKRIMYSGNNRPDGHYSELDRYNGFLSAMKRAGATPLQNRFGHRGEGEFDQAIELLKGKDRPDGILCYGATDAANFYIAARQCGISVPNDLKLIVIGGAGDAVGAAQFAVLRIPMYQVGEQAMRLLERRIDSPDTDLPSLAVRHEELDLGHTL